MTFSSDPLNICKSVLSVVALIFSIVLVCALIFDRQTNLSEEVHPALAFILFWFCLLWLSVVEGGQASMVGLPPIDPTLYEKSHPLTHRITQYGHKGDNLNRYLLGRQFMVLLLVFVINRSGAPIEGAKVLDMPEVIVEIFLVSGLAMILITCMVGQLNTQVNATLCMLDYINSYAMLITHYVCMAIEFSGLLHASYLIQYVLAFFTKKPIESNEEPRNWKQSVFFWFRVIMSVTILTLALIATINALLYRKTTIWDGVPTWLSIIIFFFLMSVVGTLEAMQICYFASSRLTKQERETNYWAKKQCDLLFSGDGHNFPGFMVGRQLMVVAIFFVLARCTTIKIEEGEGNVLGVSDSIQKVFDTGLLGALITTIVGSISWQLVAAAYPKIFMHTPITYVLLCLCLGFHLSGICNGAWVIAKVHKEVRGFKRDEEYVGTAEERAAGKVVAAGARAKVQV